MTLSKSLVAAGCAAAFFGLAAPAIAADHRGGGHRGSTGRHAAPRVYGSVRGPVARGRVYVPRYVAPYRFARPYYSFRPRLSVGFGLWSGYPFAYPYAYYDPFYYPYGSVSPYAYGYPPAGYPAYPSAPGYPQSGYPQPGYPPSNYPPSASPAPGYPSNTPPSAYPPAERDDDDDYINDERGQENMGGLSFEMTPSDAQLFVDGRMVGPVGQFSPTSQPLGLISGRHHIEVRASGYRTMSFDVDVIAGQVIPYRGQLER